VPEPITPDLRDLLALTLVPGLGPRLTAALLRRFGSAGAVRRATAAELRQVPQIGEKLSGDFAAALAAVDLDGECALVERHGVHVLALEAPDYPPALATVHAPPPLLYVAGELTPADAKAVAVVGSRGCTGYGRRVTERLAAGLARAGYTVVSGMARGVDGVAHRAALQAGGRTIAVLAGGLARLYPPEHADLAAEIRAAGALVSEAPMATEPLAALFPPRNRIISGLSRGVVVVEASERSGTLITARHAAEQGREVFAVPGPVDSTASAGCLHLIREGATLVRHVDDILEALEATTTVVTPGMPTAGVENTEVPSAAPVTPPPDLDPAARRVWDFLAESPRHADVIAQQLGLAVPELTRTLMMLEMKKLIRRLPGNQYERR
jgi:DNA processing protein